MFLHNLLNVLAQIADRMRLQKSMHPVLHVNHFGRLEANHIIGMTIPLQARRCLLAYCKQ
jgi:hypothetical protein